MKKKHSLEEKNNLKAKIESILFASAKIVDLAQLIKLTGAKEEEIRKSIDNLSKEYLSNNSSLIIVDYEDSWKLTVKNDYMNIVEQVVSETELPKSILETLAIIAFRHPILQADVVKIRSNKAYDHLVVLEELGFIKREKFGRTNKLNLTQKFFDYFELPPGKLREAFSSFNAVSKVIDNKERELLALEKKMEEEKIKTDEDKEKIGLLDVYENPLSPDDFLTYDNDEFISDENQGNVQGNINNSFNVSEKNNNLSNNLINNNILNKLNRNQQKIINEDIKIKNNNEQVVSDDKLIENNNKQEGNLNNSLNEHKQKHFTVNLYTPEGVDLSIIPQGTVSEVLKDVPILGKKDIIESEEELDEKKQEIKNKLDKFVDEIKEKDENQDDDVKSFNNKVDALADMIMTGKVKEVKKSKDKLDELYEQLEATKDKLGK
jgi:segregation and condensation protein B